MIQISKEEWNKIPNSYKGVWTKEIIENGWQPDLPKEYIGRKNILSGCISDEMGGLLTEGVHFEITS